MGTIVLQNTTVTTTANMKLFLVAALLIASACAEPESEGEAKPWLAYGNYGYGYPAYGYTGYAGYAGHHGYAGYPYTHATYAAPATTVGRYVAPYYNTYGLGYHHALGKREAEPESEAKPESWYNYYGNAYGYGYPHGNGYALPYARTYAPYGYGLRSYA